MTSTVDNCCQRAKVHRLVTLPEQSCKMSWSCCGIFSQVFVLILSTWKFGFIIFLSVIQRIIIILSPIQLLIIFLSPIQRIIIFLSPIQRIIIFLSPIQRIISFLSAIQCLIIWFLLSASKLLFFISKCKPALIFCSSRYETVSNCCFKTISYLLLLGLFDYVSNAISNYVQNF